MTDVTCANRTRLITAWFLTSIVGGLLVGMAVGAGCVVDDPDYCASDDICVQSKGSEYMCSNTLKTCILRSVNSCSRNDDCTDPSLPFCDPSVKRCMPCVLGESGDQACSRFVGASVCGTAPGSTTRCVACRENSHCPESAPICQNQACRKCSKHSDCEGTLKCHDGTLCTNSLVCIGAGELTPGTEGRCALNGDRGQVIYVRKDASCKSSTDAGTLPTTPVCTIDDGYTTAVTQTNRMYIRVIGDNSPAVRYPTMSMVIDKGKFVFIGSPSPALSVTQPARILSQGTSFRTGNSANVTVDEFALTLNKTNENLFECTGSYFDFSSLLPSLTVRNSTLEGPSLPGDTLFSTGIAADRCDLRVYNNIIGVQTLAGLQDANAPAFEAGISLGSLPSYCKKTAKAEIYNNVIAGNLAVGIDLSGLACSLWSIDLRFNTVYGNGRRMTSIGGLSGPPLRSPPAVVSVSQSLFKNRLMANGSQFAGADTITWKDVVVSSMDTVNLPGISKADFELETGFVTKSNSSINSSCCIDKAKQGTGETFPSFDAAGHARPQGAGYDIGAFEVR